MIEQLSELYNWASKQNDMVAVNILERLIQRVNNGELLEDDLPIPTLHQRISRSVSNSDESSRLLIHVLIFIDNYELRVIRKALNLEVARRRNLLSRLNAEKQEAIRRNDAIAFLKIERELQLLREAPEKTRQIDPETVDLAIKALELKDKHGWSYPRISTELFGDPSEADRIKKAVQRAREAARLPE